MNEFAKWIKTAEDIGNISPKFSKSLNISSTVKKATISASAMGVYNLFLNGCKVGNAVLAPGFTSYTHRVLYQEYDITELLRLGENLIEIIGGKGWAISHFGNSGAKPKNFANNISVIASVTIEYIDGTVLEIVTDETWTCSTTEILDSEIYHGETVDKTAEIRILGHAVEDTETKPTLERQEHKSVIEQQRLGVQKVIKTPKGETVLDFGQNISGYAEVYVKGKRGERIVLSHAEVLDRDGNFYTENMRKARNLNTYVLSGEDDIFKPSFCYQGFRYIRLDEYPDTLDLNTIVAVVIHTDMERTGRFICGNDNINTLYSNIIWGQKDNFVDIPTDCNQRDERLGWTADIQVFCRTAAINFNVESFLDKWLRDMYLEQRADGSICRIVPFYQRKLCGRVSAGWSDAATVVPWELYRAYGNKEILEKYYEMMTKWVDYIHNFGDEEFLWIGGDHYGDWLALDGEEGAYRGATQTDLIASAYFAYSTSIIIKAGRILGRDVSSYEKLLSNIKQAFRAAFMKDGLPVIYPKGDAFDTQRTVKADTQTACAMILCFDLCEPYEREALAAHLVELIEEVDGHLATGFLGTPLLLHALSKNGYHNVAYSLLLEERAPSWLFSVKHGATTVWEHWDSIKRDGSFWPADMNSFNHYAYGSVFDWIFEYVGGISICDGGEGYSHICISPITNRDIGFADVGIKTKYGELSVRWEYTDDKIKYDIVIPDGVVADVCLTDIEATLIGGRYVMYSSQGLSEKQCKSLNGIKGEFEVC